MPSSNKTSFVAEVLNFNVKDNVTGYFLIANRHRLPIKEDFEGNTNILHFISNGVGPKGIVILLVKLKGFFGSLMHFNAKCMGPFKISWIPLLHKRYNSVPLFEDMTHPPVACWFVVKSYDFSIFGSLNGMRFLQFNEVFPGGRAVFPLAA